MAAPAVQVSRRSFLSAALAASLTTAARAAPPARPPRKGRVAITLDLEMSRHYPTRGMLEWDYRKGDLDEPTKEYALRAAELVKARGGVIHFFLVGRVLEQPDIGWLKRIAEAGHPIGNHTYDHVHLKAASPEATQFRFQRAPWLVRGKTTDQVLRENIELTTAAMKDRAGLAPRGFRTPGGFHNGLADRPDLQRMLLDLGFRWVSSKYPSHASGQPGEPPGEDVYASIVAAQKEAQPFVYSTGLVEIPMSPISDVGAFRSQRWKLEWFLEATRRSIEWAIRDGGAFDFLAHPSCLVVEDPKFETLKLICDLVEKAGERAEIVDLDTLARDVAA
ncbi:MAG: polysaccharide deacetylase family protein [Planctomycetes bacterium]|nr:polysaccharide deacetylase family protein [Planctomycetota bacterium]